MLNCPKIIVALLLVASSFEISAYSQAKKKSDAEERELFGRVHEVRLTRKTIMTMNGDREFGGWVPSLSIFNKSGFLEQFEAFDDKGESQYKIICQFNASGQKIEEIEIKANGEKSRKRTFVYDKNGNQIEMNDFYGENDKPGSSYRSTFNDKGFEIGVVGINAENKLFQTTYKLRNDNNESIIYYDSDGKVTGKTLQIINRDKDNQTEELAYLDAGGNVRARYVTVTDKKGDVTEIEYDDSDKILEKRVRIYERDSQGNWIKEIESNWLNMNNQMVLRKKQETIRVITYF